MFYLNDSGPADRDWLCLSSCILKSRRMKIYYLDILGAETVSSIRAKYALNS